MMHATAQSQGIDLSCPRLTRTASGDEDLFGILSQIGSTSGPSRSPAPSQPQHQTALNFCERRIYSKKGRREGRRTVFGTRRELYWLGFFLCEQPIVGTEPYSVLWVRSWIVWETAESCVPSNGGEVSSVWMNDVEHTLTRERRWGKHLKKQE